MTRFRDSLSDSQILALSERDSGAFGLADEALRQRLRHAVDWINERGPYTHDEAAAMREQLRQLLCTRLKLLLDRQRFPAITEQAIIRPIFIIGFARSGTTLLHSLLAEDPDVHAPRSWHMYAPSPPPGAGPVAAERIAFAQRQVEAWMDFAPAQKQMHPYVDKGAFQLCEDEEVFALDFRNAYSYHFYKVPTIESYIDFDNDGFGAFSFHREVLQHLQWNTGKSRWVCKGPSAQANLEALFATYPDALCVWPHRPIAEIFASFVSVSMAVYDAITGIPYDWAPRARALAAGIKGTLDGLMANAIIDDPRIVHIPFRSISHDPLAVIQSIYARQQRAVSPAFAQRVKAWLADPDNAVDRHGRYPYSYDAIGIKREEIEELFAEYSNVFGLNDGLT